MGKFSMKKQMVMYYAALVAPTVFSASLDFNPHTVGSLEAAAKAAGHKESDYLYLFDKDENYRVPDNPVFPDDKKGGLYVWDLTFPVEKKDDKDTIKIDEKDLAEKDEDKKKEEPKIDYSIKNLLDPKKISIVMFYAPWCGHCQHFKATMIKAAKTIPGEVPEPIAFYAVSCVANHDVCLHYNVHGYPYLGGFMPGEGDPEDAIELSSISFMGEIIEKLHLTFTAKKDKRAGESLVSSTKKDPSEAGQSGVVLPGVDPSVTAHMTKSDVFKYKYVGNKKEIFSDAALSFAQVLKTGIYDSEGPLSIERANAFIEWIHLLNWALPPEWGVRDFVSDLLSDMSAATSGAHKLEELVDLHNPSEWGIGLHNSDTSITSFKDAGFSDRCSHGEDGMGYTCGMWSLFHIVTIGVAERFMHATERGEIAEVENAALALRNFVANFFGCKVCRDHFTELYDSCEYRDDNCTFSSATPDEAKKLPIWLWAAHNDVNARLVGERAEDEKRKVTQVETDFSYWPSERECAYCWYDDSHDEKMVYKYMKEEFWPTKDEQFGKHIRSEKIPSEKLSLRVQKVSAKEPLQWVLLSTVLSFILFSCLKDRNREKSGRHKKLDDSFDKPHIISKKKISNDRKNYFISL